MNHSESELENALSYNKNIDIVGYLAPFVQKSHFKYLGIIASHTEVILEDTIDEVIVLSNDLPYELRKSLFEYCQIEGVTYRYIGNLYETSKQNAHIDFI